MKNKDFLKNWLEVTVKVPKPDANDKPVKRNGTVLNKSAHTCRYCLVVSRHSGEPAKNKLRILGTTGLHWTTNHSSNRALFIRRTVGSMLDSLVVEFCQCYPCNSCTLY